MAMFLTPNGVKVTFDNNIILGMEEGDPPLLSFDNDKNLIEVNFDGYRIERVQPRRAMSDA